MLSSLLAGVCPPPVNVEGAEDGSRSDLWAEHEQRAGVILRREQVKFVLFEGKSNMGDFDGKPHSDNTCAPILGTLTAVCGKEPSVEAIAALPDWLEHGVDSALRHSEEPIAPVVTALSSSSAPTGKVAAAASPIVLTPRVASPSSQVGSGVGGGKGPWMDLDKFYEDTQEAEEEEYMDDDDDDEGDEDGDGNEDTDGDTETETETDGDEDEVEVEAKNEVEAADHRWRDTPEHEDQVSDPDESSSGSSDYMPNPSAYLTQNLDPLLQFPSS